ncbi:uncharacterized protein LOC110906288 isoform X2 [Helianthus annuus]|nr:uncharacterized protein LOC110906288 isoform X2 [Helianthus annuus]
MLFNGFSGDRLEECNQVFYEFLGEVKRYHLIPQVNVSNYHLGWVVANLDRDATVDYLAGDILKIQKMFNLLHKEYMSFIKGKTMLVKEPTEELMDLCRDHFETIHNYGNNMMILTEQCMAARSTMVNLDSLNNMQNFEVYFDCLVDVRKDLTSLAQMQSEVEETILEFHGEYENAI